MLTLFKTQTKSLGEQAFTYYEYLGDGLLFVGEGRPEGGDEVYLSLYDQYACLHRMTVKSQSQFHCSA
jgi:hypothetical protein